MNDHDMEKYYALIRQIEQLIRDRPLVKYVCPKVYREGISAKVKAYQRDPIPPEALLSANKTLNGEHLIEHTMHSCSRQARKEAASNKKQKINQEQRIEKQIFSNRKKSMARCANVRRRRKRK